MLYLGREKDTGDRVMLAPDGRTYHGIERWA